MLAAQIVRADRAADSLLGGPGVREFAACEFPREDPAWVRVQTRRPRSRKGSGLRAWARALRARRPPEESEPETDTISEPALA